MFDCSTLTVVGKTIKTAEKRSHPCAKSTLFTVLVILSTVFLSII